jgi:NitT/TauT family transport system ATP-binding protein
MILAFSGVDKSFTSSRASVIALENINLSVRAGEFVCIIGPSGCGKSTLLKLAGGLDTPTKGEVAFEGEGRILVFQEPALMPWLNTYQNAELGLKLQNVKDSDDVIRRYLNLVGLTGFDRAYPHELSWGMKQRLQLARALSVKPQLLLMDEPFAALDAQTRDTLQLELQRIWREVKCAILFVTHNVREAVVLADRILVMTRRPGTIREEVRVNLERPRFIDSHRVVGLAARLRKALA